MTKRTTEDVLRGEISRETKAVEKAELALRNAKDASSAAQQRERSAAIDLSNAKSRLLRAEHALAAFLPEPIPVEEGEGG